MKVWADTDALRDIAVDIGKIPAATVRNVPTAIQRTAMSIKNEWAAGLQAEVNRSFHAVPGSVDFSMEQDSYGLDFGGMMNLSASVSDVWMVEIGPNLGRPQGAFAGWFERGAVDGVPALGLADKLTEKYVDDFETGLEKAIGRAIEEAL